MRDGSNETRATGERTEDCGDDIVLNAGALRLLGSTVLVATIPVVVVLAIAVAAREAFQTDVWFVLLVPFCGALGGLFLGFLYAAVGRESGKFGPAVAAIGSALSGAGAVELVRTDGSLRHLFDALAASVGLQDQSALIGFLLVASVAAGFLWMYSLKTLAINRGILQAQRDEDGYNAALQRISSTPSSHNAVDPAAPVKLSPSALRAAREITDAPKPAQLPALRERGKAQYLQGHHEQAVQTMREVLAQLPNDRTALQHIALALLCINGRETEAIPYLRQLVKDPNAPIEAWKLLGYALLYVEADAADRKSSLEESLRCTDRYLGIFPQDAGALLNRACALAQLAEFDKRHLTEMLAAVRKAVAVGGEEVRQTIASRLSHPGEDFAPWADQPEFQAALSA